MTTANPVKVAIAGVGNCAASLVQGVHYYRDASPEATVPGLMHVQFGPYHVGEFNGSFAFPPPFWSLFLPSLSLFFNS